MNLRTLFFAACLALAALLPARPVQAFDRADPARVKLTYQEYMARETARNHVGSWHIDSMRQILKSRLVIMQLSRGAHKLRLEFAHHEQFGAFSLRDGSTFKDVWLSLSAYDLQPKKTQEEAWLEVTLISRAQPAQPAMVLPEADELIPSRGAGLIEPEDDRPGVYRISY